MEKSIAFLLLVMLAASISETSAECVSTSDGEYYCDGGQFSDLENIPSNAGSIVIKNMEVTKLTVSALERFGDMLQRFQCSYCKIREIEPGTFKSFSSLEQLILDNNQLTNVNADWFSNRQSLTYLDLTYNKIKNIEDKLFAYIPEVTDLRLSGNYIDCVNTKALSNLKNLKRIYLAEIPSFKCPRVISEFLRKENISLEKDKAWDALPKVVEEEFLKKENSKSKSYEDILDRPAELVTFPTSTTSLPNTTRPQRDEITNSRETLAPNMTTEDIDISAVWTTNSLPQTPVIFGETQTVEASSEIIDKASVVTPEYPKEPCERVTVTAVLSPTTKLEPIPITEIMNTPAPVVITPSRIPVISYTPKPTEPPRYEPNVLPTSGEQQLPVVPPIRNGSNHTPSEYHAVPTNSTYNLAARPNRINEYLISILVTVYCCTFL